MRDVHKRAEAATKFQEVVLAAAMFWVLIVSLGWIALRGDDIRAHRLGITTEQLQSLEESEARLERIAAEREHTCGQRCIARIPTEGEVWE